MYLLFFVSLKHPKDTPAEPTTSQHGSISDKEEHRSRLRLTSSETHSKYSHREIGSLGKHDDDGVTNLHILQ